MKLYEKQLVNTVVDRVCDVCGNSVMIDVNGHKYEEVGELKAHWGYGSKEDGTAYHLDLCEDCFRYAVSSLRELRRSTIMFDKDQEFPNEDFGIDKSRTS
ncbi:hypothetical protein [Shewanella xiamenensis]|uniref:hypothetical protein n=1 Tax=Shewanella xiamenensis TaxID=332186 RepID=UPI0024A6B272|nr:hypothetical protein [Shewanella xiamenensis]MDI5874904.1 hypothetical protein [Shewanella xiamenensis]